MAHSNGDPRSTKRRAKDERLAAAPRLPMPKAKRGERAEPVEAHLARRTGRGGGSVRPQAVPGVVENGLVRPLDPAVRLPEHSRVIIVAAEGT